MPHRVTHHTVVVHRDGANVTVKPGTSFDFTAEEIDSLHKNDPRTLRHLVQEGPSAATQAAVATARRGQRSTAGVDAVETEHVDVEAEATSDAPAPSRRSRRTTIAAEDDEL